MDLLSLGLIVVGLGCLAAGIGRSIAWGRGDADYLPDDAARRRALIRAEQDTRDRFGWDS